MEKLDKQCCFPTYVEMAEQIQKICPLWAQTQSCIHCPAFKENECPHHYYSKFVGAVKKLNWKLSACKTRSESNFL